MWWKLYSECNEHEGKALTALLVEGATQVPVIDHYARRATRPVFFLWVMEGSDLSNISCNHAFNSSQAVALFQAALLKYEAHKKRVNAQD